MGCFLLEFVRQFSGDYTEVMGFVEESCRGKCAIFHYIISSLDTIYMIDDVDVELDYLTEVVFVMFLYYKVTIIFPFSYCTLGRSHYAH